MKALARRATERFTTAYDLVQDLRHFLASDTHGDSSTQLVNRASNKSTATGVPIVPKGLRSFDASDADFFLNLLPGPTDRDGLPECIAFWKNKCEGLDEANAFSLGLIYGPSGCGKTSMVKAGLLPRLASHVVTVYIGAHRIRNGATT